MLLLFSLLVLTTFPQQTLDKEVKGIWTIHPEVLKGGPPKFITDQYIHSFQYFAIPITCDESFDFPRTDPG